MNDPAGENFPWRPPTFQVFCLNRYDLHQSECAGSWLSYISRYADHVSIHAAKWLKQNAFGDSFIDTDGNTFTGTPLAYLTSYQSDVPHRYVHVMLRQSTLFFVLEL